MHTLSRPLRVVLVLLVASVYLLLFDSLYDLYEEFVVILSLVPVVVAGWLLGLWPGFVAGLLSFPVNALLLNLKGNGEWNVSPALIGSITLTLAGAAVGRLRDLQAQSERQLAERQRAEQALRASEERLRTRERFLECLADISRMLLQAQEWSQVVPDVLTCLGKTTGVSRVSLFDNHPGPNETLLFSLHYEWCAPGAPSQMESPSLQAGSYEKMGLDHWIERMAQGKVITGNVDSFAPAERMVVEQRGIRSFLAVPLFVFGEWYGILTFGICDETREWQQGEIDLLQIAADNVARAIENEQVERQSAALAEAADVLTTTLDFEEVLDMILEYVGRVLPGDMVNVMLVEDNQARVVRSRGYEQFGVQDQIAGVTLSIPETASLCHMAETGEPLLISDTAAFSDWVDLFPERWLRSYAGTPIRVRGKVVGFLNVDSTVPRFFTPQHARALKGFADHAAAAIENAQLFEAVKQQARRLSLLVSVARTSTATLDVERLLQDVAESVYMHFGYPSVMLLTPGHSGTEMILRGYAGIYRDHLQTLGPHAYSQSVDIGIVGHVMRSGKPYLASDTRDDPYCYVPDEVTVRSEVCVPILDGENVVGVIDIESTEIGDFDDRDRALLEAVADSVALGLRNIRLHEETHHRVRELTLLNRISAGFRVSTLDPHVLINGVVEGLQELTGVDRAYFVTADPLEEVWQVTHASVASGITSYVGLQGTFEQAPHEMQAIQTGEPFVVSDVTTDPRIASMRELYLSLGIQSILLIPVVARGQLYGTLGFDLCREKRAWRDEEIHLAEAIASQLELALENTRLYEEAHQRAEELAVALARLEELDRLKDEFIQNVSHELRSPLALIRGYAEMLDMGELGELDSEQRKPVAIIARRARMLSDLVQDITLLLEAEVNPPEPEPVRLNELIQAAVEDFQVASHEAKLFLQAEIADPLPPVFGSSSYLRRVLDNLLSNAVKFTPERGQVIVRAYQEEQRVVLQVSDTGIGIPPLEFGRIFDRFYQVDGSSRRRYGGVGLGLALVKDIVEAYGGTIEVESELGEGTTFTVSLPIFNPL